MLNIESVIVMVKMIVNFKSLLEVLNLNNALNVNIGLKGHKDVVLCLVDVDINFVMIVVEVIVHMECVKMAEVEEELLVD